MLYAKAIVALVLSFLVPFGITGAMTIEEFLLYLVGAGVTALGVYFVPNREE